MFFKFLQPKSRKVTVFPPILETTVEQGPAEPKLGGLLYGDKPADYGTSKPAISLLGFDQTEVDSKVDEIDHLIQSHCRVLGEIDATTGNIRYFGRLAGGSSDQQSSMLTSKNYAQNALEKLQLALKNINEKARSVDRHSGDFVEKFQEKMAQAEEMAKGSTLVRDYEEMVSQSALAFKCLKEHFDIPDSPACVSGQYAQAEPATSCLTVSA